MIIRERLFLDTAFAQALLNPRDQYHQKAKQLERRMEQAKLVVTTKLVLIEIADALSSSRKTEAGIFINNVIADNQHFNVIEMDETLFNRAFMIYNNRPDKSWGLTDCVSFMVMDDHKLTHALTSDQHFVQYGFRALMLET
jgi:uncharacterized protein